MKFLFESGTFWKTLFFCLIGGYGLYYAPYGINETDGGFLTGLAWQVLKGKLLYRDILYVRPPLPVWLRAAELSVFPDSWSVLGERWVFYLEVGLYVWLAASVLAAGQRRWILACLGFVVTAHAYPAASWHTVDGTLFSVLGLRLLFGAMPGQRRPGPVAVVFAGAAIFCAALCKQSFYAMAPLFAVIMIIRFDKRLAAWGIGAMALCGLLFAVWLFDKQILHAFFGLTAGATTPKLALEHGLFDYFRIKAGLVTVTVSLLIPIYLLVQSKYRNKFPVGLALWMLWVAVLIGSYAYAVFKNQDFTAPFAQTRLLVVLSVWSLVPFIRSGLVSQELGIRLAGLLVVSWCTSISWGYNLPVFMMLPSICMAMAVTEWLWKKSLPGRFEFLSGAGALFVLAALLADFRYGYEFIYRDGRRSAMTEPMGGIFPVLNGIYSDRETADLYRDLKRLQEKYGPDFKTLPAFPQSNFLCGTYPPLPIDWVVRRENNGHDDLLFTELKKRRPVLFIQKEYGAQLETDPEFSFTRYCLEHGTRIEESKYFLVYQMKDE